MTRYARMASSSNIYHVMLRGNERKLLFLDDEDKYRFTETLERMKANNEYDVYAYCLMDNHVHLLIKEQKDPIKRTMKRICVSYAYYFHHKYDKVGHLFQDRFRSEAIEDEAYFISVVRYIHNNPVKAGIVKLPEEFEWSSFMGYSQLNSRNSLLDRNYLLRMFSDDNAKAINIFLSSFTEMTNVKFLDDDDNTEIVFNTTLQRVIADVLLKFNQKIPDIRHITDKKYRNLILNDIKKSTSASLRELSDILLISKDIIFRA